MRKIVCMILAVAMFCAVPVGISAATATLHEVYNINFNQKDSSELYFGANSEYVSGGSMKIKANEDGTITRVDLMRLVKKSDADISVDVASLAGGEGTQFQLIVYFTQGENVSEYVIDTATVTGKKWTHLSGHISTRLIEVAKIEVGISAVSGGKQVDYLLDNFIVTSSVPRAEAGPVKEISNDGNFMLRGSFETGNLERWWLYRGAIYECTDEALPHTGKYLLKVEHREDNATTLQCKINNNDVAPDMVLQVSCWVKKLPEDAVLKICIQQNVPGTNGNNWKYHNWVTIRDNEWHELTATIDLSQYNLKKDGVIDLIVSTGDQVAPGFYADDFMISGDKPGEFWDDMIVDTGEKDPTISDSAYAINGFYKPIQEDIPALKEVYKDYFKIGAAGWPSSIYEEEDERFAQLFLKHFNSYVDNGAFKANDLLKKTKRNRTEYDFTIADRVMDFATRNGIEVVGHTLVWIKPDLDYQRLTKEDGSFLTRDEALSFMKEMITKIMKHYEGDGDPSEYAEGINYEDWHITLWDVVNEAVLTDGTVRSYLGQGSWYNIIGEEYINYAYKYADEVCETNGYDIRLRYNDYAEQDKRQIDGMYQLVRNLLADDCRIDTVGFQCHFGAQYNTSLLRYGVEKIASLGVRIDGTELDFSAYTEAELTKKIDMFKKGITKERELTQANIVFETMQIFKEYHEIVDRVVFWTFYDGVSWMNTRTFNHVDYGGLFDYEYQAKPLYWAVADPEYYVKNYMKEDTSKARVSVNGEILETAENDILEQDGVVYMEAELFLDTNGVSYVENDQVYSMIIDGSYIELKEGNAQIAEFASHTLQNAALMKDGKLYLPVLEICDLFDYTIGYSDLRNLIYISSDRTIYNYSH